MDRAKYISEDGNINKIVRARDITPRQNEEIYRGYLYCNCDKCNARLVYNERQKDRFVRYFSTLPGSMHRRGCPNEVLHEGSRARDVKVSGGNINLSPDHIEEILSKAYKELYEKIHPTEESYSKRKNKSKKKNPVPLTIKEESASLHIEGIPVTSGKGRNKVIGKEPYVYKKEVSEVNQRDVGSTRELHGLVEDIRIMKDEAFVDLSGLDGSKFSVYMGTQFIDNCEDEFSLLHYAKNYIDERKSEEEPIICTSVGKITKLEDMNIVQVFDYRHIRIDNMGVYDIVGVENRLI